MVYNSILEALGNTPMIRLNHINPPTNAEVLVKFEGLNVGGSIKTRTAYQMILAAEKAGIVGPGSIIVEPTSGNQGIGLALVGAVRGYRTIIVMPDSVSIERRKLVQHYGAEVVLVHDDGDIGKCIHECLATAMRMKEQDKRVFVPQQFINKNNIIAQKTTTAKEILEQVNGPIHGFCSGIGTGGTITGIGEVLREHYPDIEIWAAEPEDAAILAGGSIGTHVQMGIGDGLIPDILNTEIYDNTCIIPDDNALDMAKRLASEEGIMCGISSGTNVVAAIMLAEKLGPGKTVVTVLPDTAERYFSTPLFEDRKKAIPAKPWEWPDLLLLFDSALFLEHGDLELLDALLYIVFSVVVLSDDVGLDALRVFVEIDYVVEIRTLYNERSCCAAPVEAGNRNASFSDLVDTVYIIYVEISPAVCFNDNSIRTCALSYDCCSP